MDGSPDISKIIGLIMENPDIIEKIRTLSDESQNSKEPSTEAIKKNNDEIEHNESITESSENTSVTASASTENIAKSAAGRDKKRRAALLCALKPYLSSERSRAIDTMLSVIEVIDIMKVR